MALGPQSESGLGPTTLFTTFFFLKEQGFTLPWPRLTLDSTGREDWPSAGMTDLLGTGLGGLQALCMPGKRRTNTLSMADLNHP